MDLKAVGSSPTSESFRERLARESSPYIDEIKQKTTINHGAFGIVSRVEARRVFAMKEIKVDRPRCDIDEELKGAYGEYESMKKNLSNVVRSYDFKYDPSSPYFFYTMDMMEMDLDTFVSKQKSPLSFEKVLSLLINITNGE